MNEPKGKVAQNTIFFTSALIIQKIFSFTYFAYLARVLDVSDAGKYVFAISFTTIFTIFIDFGLSPILTREIAKDPEKIQRLFSNILSLKVPLAILVYLIVALMVNLLNYPEITRQLVYISGIVMVFDSFTLSFWALFRGRHNLKFESIGNVLFQIIMVSLGALVLLTSKNLLFLVSAMLCASVFNFLFSLTLVRRKLRIRLQFQFDKKVIKALLIMSYPFALAAIFNRMYSYFDNVLLSKISGNEAVAFYGVAYKLIFAIQFIPLAFSAAIYPAMSSYFLHSKDELIRIFEKSTFYLMFLALPISLGVFALADKIIFFIYGSEYINSILVLQILMLSLVFLFCNYPVGALLNACNRQLTNTILQGIAMFISLVLNIILIPILSYIGSAISFFVSITLLYSMGLKLARSVIQYNFYKLIKQFIKILLVSSILAFIGYVVKEYISIFIIIPLFAIIYVVVLMSVRIIKREDLVQIKNIISKI